MICSTSDNTLGVGGFEKLEGMKKATSTPSRLRAAKTVNLNAVTEILESERKKDDEPGTAMETT